MSLCRHPGARGRPDEIVAFAAEHGLPVAIKAAFGGGGRGLKVARTIEEIPALFESATREAVAAFAGASASSSATSTGPRHVEAQVLADRYGNVIVVGTRDCSLQRGHQKLVEEAPAPFLSPAQRETIHAAAKAICREAGYHGARYGRVPRGHRRHHQLLESTRGCRSSTRSPRRPRASTWCASSSASPTGRSFGSRPIRSRAGTRSSSASTARTPAAASCPPRAR